MSACNKLSNSNYFLFIIILRLLYYIYMKYCALYRFSVETCEIYFSQSYLKILEFMEWLMQMSVYLQNISWIINTWERSEENLGSLVNLVPLVYKYMNVHIAHLFECLWCLWLIFRFFHHLLPIWTQWELQLGII